MQASPQKTNCDFSEKYSLYSNMLFRICMLHLGSREDTEEAMQEAYMKLLYKSSRILCGGAPIYRQTKI